LWSNAANWSGDTAPTLPASLIFAGSTRLNPAQRSDGCDRYQPRFRCRCGRLHARRQRHHAGR
jgi:hypothetical protein